MKNKSSAKMSLCIYVLVSVVRFDNVITMHELKYIKLLWKHI